MSIKDFERICNFCNKLYMARYYDYQKGHARFCSMSCRTSAQARPATDRVWEKIEIRSDKECWPFTGGYLNQDGYGIISERNAKIMAHRAAFMAKNGPIPDNMRVLHKCDNPPCCNPNHLFLGTQADNVADMINKGRANKLKGKDHWKSKLTEKDVLKIRESYGELTRHELARKFKVHHNTIMFIVNRKTWAHI